MRISGIEAQPGLALAADVVVVGTGPGGASVAAKLARAGRSVVMVETGSYVPASEMNQRESEMMRKLYYEGGLRTSENGAMGMLHGRAVGGSSVVNYLDCFRTPPRLLRDWQRRFGLDELAPERMAPRFDAIEEVLHVRKLDPGNLNKNNDKLRQGTERLGWKGDTFHRNAYQCYGSGFCDLGCSYNAKQSAAITYVPIATQHGATLLTEARVDRVETSGNRATGVRGTLLGADRQPRGEFTVTADVVVVSGGAIHTPYLLLSSGVDDPSGQLGENFYTHPGTPVVGYFPEERIANYEGIKQGYYIGEFSWVLHEHPMDVLIEGIGAPPALTSSILPGLGAERQADFRRYNHYAAAGLLLRDYVPGRIRVGKGRPIIDASLAPSDAHRLRLSAERAAEAWLAAGATMALTAHSKLTYFRSTRDFRKLDEVGWGPGEIALVCFHQMGTARMGSRRDRSVVSPTGRMWSYDNLYVADASIFPTSTGVNPQETVYGLADVVGDGILDETRSAASL